MKMYLNSVGHNSTLIMGLTPDPRGLLPEPDVQRLKEWGAEISKKFSSPLGETNGTGSRLIMKLKEPKTLSYIVLQEDIELGERVRKYYVEARINGKWKRVAEGLVIGHKRIQEVEPVSTKELRVIIEESVAEPVLKSFKVY
jgi:alpha-L-fucosidase